MATWGNYAAFDSLLGTSFTYDMAQRTLMGEGINLIDEDSKYISKVDGREHFAHQQIQAQGAQACRGERKRRSTLETALSMERFSRGAGKGVQPFE